MLYKLEYLPAARKDILDIVKYISQKLANPDAAERLATAFIEKSESLKQMPYINPVYTPIRPLRHEYRRAIVGNYRILYWIDEQKQLITVARIVYSKRDFERDLT